MTSESIGKFICELRKEIGMTQKEMAEQLGVSDKTVSKWETGRGIPDTTILNKICDVLHISVVELLSGEKLDDTVKQASELDMESLLRKREEIEKDVFWKKIGLVIGIVNLILILFGILMYGSINFSYFFLFLDIPSLIFVIGLLLIGLCLTSQLRYFLKSFTLLIKKAELEIIEVKKIENALSTAIGIVLFSGVLVTLIQVVIVLATTVGDYTLLGTYIAVSLLTTLYGVVFGLIMWIMRARISLMYK